MNIPKDTEAQSGCSFPQSIQDVFPGSFRSWSRSCGLIIVIVADEDIACIKERKNRAGLVLTVNQSMGGGLVWLVRKNNESADKTISNLTEGRRQCCSSGINIYTIKFDGIAVIYYQWVCIDNRSWMVLMGVLVLLDALYC
jgi:hypothetical protein